MVQTMSRTAQAGKKKPSNGKPARSKKPQYTARTADKHALYQLSVQSAESEVDFCLREFRKRYGENPTHFREDFCGTALICCEWARRSKDHIAYGVDLDKPTLEWGMKHNIASLKPDQQGRVHLINDNVLNVSQPKVHFVGAFNFSYFLLMERSDLVRYFSQVKKSLRPNGLFFLDAYGGWEAQEPMEEETEQDGFTYVWDQADYNPIDDTALCHIHFKFPDGTKMMKAFSYRWRLWTLGSIKDALADAGFKSVDVYWEGEDKNGEGNGIYRKTKKAENTPGWNAYLVAQP